MEKTKFNIEKINPYIFSIVRMAIGWHFLYEGISKIIAQNWSSAPYLSGSKWIFAPVFNAMAENSTILAIVDFLNIWGLILIGLGLMVGMLSRLASAFGSIMLIFYFLAYPPIPGYTFGVPVEGSYLWVNKTLIEFLVLILFCFIPGSYHYGIDRLYARWKDEKARQPVADINTKSINPLDRREMLRNLISVPALGVFAYALYRKKKWDSFEEKLLQVEGIDANSSATLLSFNYSTVKDLKGKVPVGNIKYTDKDGKPANFELSRLVMGGNLIGGWAHARDLIYVSKLVKTYHTDAKVMQTLALGEQCGINAIISNPQHGRIFQKYKHEFRSKMKFISDCGTDLDFQKGITLSLAGNFDALYCQGEITDRWTNPEYDDPKGRTVAQRMELIRQGLEEIRRHGKLKTCHSHNYWSSLPTANWNDNMFDYDPKETIRFMGTLNEPWIAFKVLAAGAIKPEDGLKYAYTNGADFVCLGMYDFQIVEDVNIALNALDQAKVRQRPWMG